MHGAQTCRHSRSRSAAGFGATFLASVAGLLLLTAALTIWRDPFWVLREAPPWTRAGLGESRLLDLEMRRVKPLQLARIRPETVLVGSSVVYRGLDPADLAPSAPHPVYNAGLSSLMAGELPALAALVRNVGSARRVVIGLDYYMFTSLPPPPALQPELATAAGRADALLRTVFNSGAVENLLSRPRRNTEPGSWRADGFKTTPDFDAALTMRIAAAQDIAAMAYRPERLAGLAEALSRLRGLEVELYLSPVSRPQLRLLDAGGRLPEFERWRADVAALVASHGLRLADLATDHPFDDFEPGKGSSRFWIDNVHFKPAVGNWVLARLAASASGAVAPLPQQHAPAGGKAR
jgi:hypothetical protein